MNPERILFMTAILVCIAVGSAHAASWSYVTTLHGVRITSRPVAGQDLPEFRGVATVGASVFEVLAVIEDASRHCEWMSRCAETRVLERRKGFERVIYQRIDSPWPVEDRDAVVTGQVKINLEKKQVISAFRSVRHRKMPEKNGVVRLRALRGSYRLTALSDNKTRIVYQVVTDPGGSLPRWLARKATEVIPAETIHKLKQQVYRTRGQYNGFLNRFDPSRGGKIPKL